MIHTALKVVDKWNLQSRYIIHYSSCQSNYLTVKVILYLQSAKNLVSFSYSNDNKWLLGFR